MVFFGTQERATPKSIVQCGRKSNLSEILWLSWLPASLKTVHSKVKALSSGQHFLHYKSMGKVFVAQGYEGNGPIWPNLERIIDFMTASLMNIRSKMKSLSSGP